MKSLRSPTVGDDHDPGTARMDRQRAGRRVLLGRLGAGAGCLAGRSLLGGAAASLVSGLLAAPAGADTALDVRILQTASSLERLAVDIYGALLVPGSVPDQALGGVPPGPAQDTVRSFLATTVRQHSDHLRALQAQTTALGGAVQDAPNPRFRQTMGQQLPNLVDPARLVDFLAALEKLATDTYLSNLSMLQDRRSKEILAGVMGVEAQHLATLRAVGALLGSPQLLAVPFPQAGLTKLPGAICARAFPDALHRVEGPDGIADPSSGAVG